MNFLVILFAYTIYVYTLNCYIKLLDDIHGIIIKKKVK